jgi:cyclic pyranopterin phosphate synthase
MPEEGVAPILKTDLLSSQELLSVIETASSVGMRKVRFTGGEPLLRKDIESLIEFARTAGFEDISLTTNGFGLAERSERLGNAGLNRINISLDTLDPDRFRSIARRGELKSVMDGIEAALASNLHPVKINVVAMKGYNADEFSRFAQWSRLLPIHVRFIELMPIRWNLDEDSTFNPFLPHGKQGGLQLRQSTGGMLSGLEMRKAYVSTASIKAQIESEIGTLEPAHIATNGPARTFRLPGAMGTVGFISQISNELCAGCNRLRLTADGFLRPCLMSDGEIDLKPSLRSEPGASTLEALFRHVVEVKPERHYLNEGQQVTGRNMSQIGG